MTSTSNKVIPTIQFLQNGNSLIVQRTPANVEWKNITVSGGTPPHTDTTKVIVGDVITGCSGTVTVAYEDTLIGTFTFY